MVGRSGKGTWHFPPLPSWPHRVGKPSQHKYTKTTLIGIQEGEATRILCKYHANGGDERHPLVVFEMAQIRYAVRVDKETDAVESWAALVSTPGNRKRMIIIIALAVFSQWRYVCYLRKFIPTSLYSEGVPPAGKGPTLTLFALCSGNGLVSYYIHLTLQGVGVDDLNTQGAINGGLQVRKFRYASHEFH